MKDIDVNSQEFKEKVAKMNSDFLTKLFEKENRIKKMSSSDEYILWLNKFTETNPEFSDEDFIYFPEKIGEYDNNYVDDLGLFFEVIDRYAEKNYIPAIPCDFGKFYPIRYGDFGYHIGCLRGQGVVCFCHKVPVINKDNFIDYNDIMNNKVQPYVEEINSSLEDLKYRVRELYNRGIPVEVIKSEIDGLIAELERDFKEKINSLGLKLK